MQLLYGHGKGYFDPTPWELHEQGVSTTRIAKQVGKHRETVGLWLSSIENVGLLTFLDSHRAAKRVPRPKRQTPLATKQLMWMLREREEGCCGPTSRSKGKQRNVKRGIVPEATEPRQVVQRDTVHFGAVYAFTAVDTCAREADVYLTSTLTANSGALFLAHCMPRRYNGFAELIQTDGGPSSRPSSWSAPPTRCDRHRIARPYKKNEQSFIESFNRTLRRECLGWMRYKPEQITAMTDEALQFLDRYH